MSVVTDRTILAEIARLVTGAGPAVRPDIPPPTASDPEPECGPTQAEGPSDPDPPPFEGSSSSASPSRMGGPGAAPTARPGGRARSRRDSPADLDRRLAFYPQTDLGNAERFRDRYRGRLVWCAAMGWLWWDGRRWSREGADDQVSIAAHGTVRQIQEEARSIEGTPADLVVGKDVMLSDCLKAWGRKSESNDKLNRLARQASAYLSVPPSRFDADPLAVNCRNGTLFLRRPGEAPPKGVKPTDGDNLYFLKHDPEDYITRLVPVDYDAGAEAPRFLKFLSEVQPHPEQRRQLAAWKGYSLTGDVGEQKLSMFYGTGSNGKSVFEDITSYVAGDYAMSIPIETFLDDGQARRAGQATPDLAGLPGVRMLRTSEPNKGAALNEGLIKLATGGEPIRARHLNRDFFEFHPQFKLTLSGNHRPQIRGADEGIWRRVVLVPWTVTITDDRKDPQLTNKLRAEASGILNWMLDGLRDFLEHGLPLAAETRAATAEYRRDSDQLGRFLEACTAPAPGERVQSSVLHEVFCAWCTANSLSPWKGRSFSDALTERGYRKDKSSVMFWLDLRLTRSKSDFVDHEGRALRVGEDTPAPDHPTGDPTMFDDDVPY